MSDKARGVSSEAGSEQKRWNKLDREHQKQSEKPTWKPSLLAVPLTKRHPPLFFHNARYARHVDMRREKERKKRKKEQER